MTTNPVTTTGSTGSTGSASSTGASSAGGGGSSIRLGQPVDTLGTLKGQVQEAGTQAEQLATGPVAAAVPALVWPGYTGTALAAAAAVGAVTSRGQGWRSRARAFALTAGGTLAWTIVGAAGLHGALAWWQDLLALGAAAAPGAATSWLARPEPEPEVVEPVVVTGSVLPVELEVVRHVLVGACVTRVTCSGRG